MPVATQAKSLSAAPFPYARVTTLLFFVVFALWPMDGVFTFLSRGGVFASAGDFSIWLLTWFAPGLFTLILALWSFLREPPFRIRQSDMKPLEKQYPELARRVMALPAVRDFRFRVTLLRIPTDRPSVVAFGTWTHPYIAISDGAVALWNDARCLDAVLLHEMGHIASGDYWKANLAWHYIRWYAFVYLYGTLSYLAPALLGDATRAWGGIWNVLFGTQLFLNAILLYLCVRALYRIRELAADDFAARQLGDISALEDAFAPLVVRGLSTGDIQMGFSVGDWGNRMTRLLGWHPSDSLRLMVLHDPLMLANESNTLALIAGMAVGTVTTTYGTIETAGVLMGGMLVAGPLILLLLARQFGAQSWFQQMKLFASSATMFGAGAALAMALLLGTSTLSVISITDNQTHLRVGGDLTYHVFYMLDLILVTAVVVPVVLFGIAALVWCIARSIVRIVRANSEPPVLMVWSALAPAILLSALFLLRWWQGQPASLSAVTIIAALACLAWFILGAAVIAAVCYLKTRVRARSSTAQTGA
jgi:Zn-dependent protease with chaperone function